MKKPNHWKQDTPKEQSVAILGAIEGWLGNLENGDSSQEKVLGHIKSLLKDLRLLCYGDYSKEMEFGGWMDYNGEHPWKKMLKQWSFEK